MSKQVMLLESSQGLQEKIGAQIAGTLVESSADGFAKFMLTNHHSFIHKIEEGTDIGHAIPVDIVGPEEPELQLEAVNRKQLQVNMGSDSRMGSQCEQNRKKRDQLVALLEKYHEIFSLTEGERGETELTQMYIDTGDAILKKQPVRRVPFAIRQEVAKELQKMQSEGVIQPLNSPWGSAIMLVCKKDRALWLCVIYRHLNSVTKHNTFPLP